MARPLTAPDNFRRLILGSGAVAALALVVGAFTASPARAGNDDDNDDSDDGDDDDNNDDADDGDDSGDDDDRSI